MPKNMKKAGMKYKTGGSTRKVAKKPMAKAQKGKIIKSKKVRKADLNNFGSSSASVSKTNRKGKTVTKSVDTIQGFVPYGSQTKTVTDAQGNTTSKTKDIGWNKALKKQNRIAKKVGRNPNDEYKTGGATKAKKVAKPMMKRGGSTIVGMPGYNARTTTMKYGGKVMNAKSLRGKSSKKGR